jgi:lipid A disaccharide synthetase
MPQQPSATAQVVTFGVSGDYIKASSIRELVQMSSLVVIGQVAAIGGTFNMARDQNDISRPDPNVLEIGQIYQIQV